MKSNRFLIKYRIKNKDRDFVIKLKLASFLFIFIISFGIIYFLKPTTILASILKEKSENYATASTNKYSFQGDFKKISNEKYIIPANGVITSNYGMRTDPINGKYSKHTGIDISCYTHRDNIYSVADGIVTFAGKQSGYGYCVEIKHVFENETIYSFYAHLSKVKVKLNEAVTQGQIIGNEGGEPGSDPNPGNSTGHHLHFELRKNSGFGNDINPTFIFG